MARRIRRCDSSPLTKTMLIASLWVVPFMGAFIAYADTRRSVEPDPTTEPPLEGIVSGPPPAMLEIGGLSSVPVSSYISVQNGYPLVDWDGLTKWASSA